MARTSTVMAAVGEALRDLRKRRGLSLLALARKSGIDDSQLGKMERGLRGTTPLGYQRLAEALGVSLSSLFAGAPVRSSRRRGPGNSSDN